MEKNNSSKKGVDTSNYKGVRDFYPEDMFIQDYIMSTWHHVLENYGYEHYSASLLESSDIYKGKTSDEIVSEQTYNFTDRGGREITLRPEMTPTVARMIAKKRRELSFPLRWYSIPNVFRYERPQKGRLREHWQLNVDLFGIDTLDAEAEAIDIAYSVMKKFGLNEKDFTIKISDRGILNKIIEDLGIDKSQEKEFKNLLDKKAKLSAEEFESKMKKITNKEINLSVKANDNVQELIKKLDVRGIKNVVFDPTLVRGFDYYTGIVFEIFDNNPENNRSLFGGGRYDNLMEIFDVDKISAVGFGMGDVTIREALEIRNLLPTGLVPAHLYICNIDKKANDFSAVLANDLRKEGLDVIVDYTNKKVSDQIKRADKKSIPFIICIGESEVKKNKFKIKDLRTAKEKAVPRGDIVRFVKNNLTS